MKIIFIDVPTYKLLLPIQYTYYTHMYSRSLVDVYLHLLFYLIENNLFTYLI